MRRIHVFVTAFVMTFGLPLAVHAQSNEARNAPLQGPVSWEFGQDVYTGSRGGELAMYFGVSQGNNLIAFRFGALDETDAVPCSIGVTYQYIHHGNAPMRIKPTAGLSLARVYSCASSGDPRQSSPSVHGTVTGSAGIRIAMFNGTHVAGSLDVMGFMGRLSGPTQEADRNTRGVMLGVAIHAPRR